MIAQGFRTQLTSSPHICTLFRPALTRSFAHAISSRTLTRSTAIRALAPKSNRHKRPPLISASPSKASSWSLLAIVGATLTAAVLLDSSILYLNHSEIPVPPPPASANQSSPSARALPRTPSHSEMPIAPGHLGNLTPEQELKLQEFWTLTFKTFGIQEPNPHPAAPAISAPIAPTSEPPTDTDSSQSTSKKNPAAATTKKRSSFFTSKKHHDLEKNNATTTTSSPSHPTNNAPSNDPNDKYSQTKEFQQTLSTLTPEQLRTAFWSMVKSDHPDALLLRFLRARKWDVQRALVMLISTMRWRSQEMHVDDNIMRTGEGGALEDSLRKKKKKGEKGEEGVDDKGGDDDDFARREGEDFLMQLRKGEGFLHGLDREGRPVCFIRCALHKPGEQSDRAMERYTVFLIETARLLLRPPVETATILFDMTHFTLSNMDYTPVKFIIKIFEAHYPESLGLVLVHKAPWVFQGIWAIVKGWLDPVVAAKVHFTKSVADLDAFIPRSRILTALGGDEDWEFRYVEPVPGENEAMVGDGERRGELERERGGLVVRFQDLTFRWVAEMAKAGPGREVAEELVSERAQVAEGLRRNYWALDPFIRARSLYDRQGMIGRDGVIDFYPQPGAGGGGAMVNGALVPAPMKKETETRADDVD